MGIAKDRCVCEICSCGKHHCGPDNDKFKGTGKLDLKNQGDIYVATKASFNFPDTLNLFQGSQSHTSVVRGDYQAHGKVGVERPRPRDQIGIPLEKMASLTVTGEYPAHQARPLVPADRASAAPTGHIKMSSSTSYGKEFVGKSFCKTAPKLRPEGQMTGPQGELDMTTINQADFGPHLGSYGRPYLHTIPDSNVFGVSSQDKVSKDTTVREHFQKFQSAPAVIIKGERTSLEFGSAARVIPGSVNASVYAGDFQQAQPRARKRRGTEVDFGSAVDHATVYSTHYQGKSEGRSDAAVFDDTLNLFCSPPHLLAGDMKSVVQADYRPHSKVGVERHRPKDVIEIPSDKMSAETITLGHFPPPPAAAESAANNSESAARFDITQAMPNYKMSTETSYKEQFPFKKATRNPKATFKDEISPSTGKLDMATLQRTDYLKFNYGRPTISKMEDNNLFGLNYDIGRSELKTNAPVLDLEEEDVSDSGGVSGLAGISVSRGSVRSVKGAADMQVESLPSSRGSVRVKLQAAPDLKSSPIIRAAGGAPTEPSVSMYGQDFTNSGGKTRSSKKQDASINFGAAFYADTSYRNEFTTKQCLVPSLHALEEYTFKAIKDGHKVYKVDCGCPPRGACGCPPPPK